MNTAELARALAERTRDTSERWEQALEACRPLYDRARLAETDLRLLAESTLQAREFEALIELLAEKPRREMQVKSPLDRIRQSGEAHPYGLREWIEGLVVIQNHLVEHRRSSDFEHILGYLNCCAEAGSYAPITPRLPDLVEDLLEQYGYAGRTEE